MKAIRRTALICILALAASLPCFPQAILSSDSLALVALYNSTNGPGWTNKTNWLTGRVSTWYGIGTSGNRVYYIQLYNNNLSGPLPAAIGNLTALQYLELGNNKLSGSLPSTIGNLVNLISLYLPNNQLSGPIPESIGNMVNLQQLYLYGNQLTGGIPYTIANLTNLQYLTLSSNKLTGQIPAEIGFLINLINLELYGNQFYGKIPKEIGNLNMLQYLQLGYNKLTGDIPAEIGNLVNLSSMSLYSNQLTGSIPAAIGAMTNLYQLDLSNNQFTGSIPSQLGNLPNLQYLYLSSNKLTGEIPSQLANLTQLRYIYLNNNQLTGSIPAAIGNLTNLENLYIYSNQISGTIPSSVSGLIKLRQFNASNNLLTGNIPSEIGSLPALQRLDLYNNKLSGQIPSSIGNLINLTSLNLYNNLLSGEIPASVGNLTKLTSLNLYNNQLSGQIPAALGSLTNLTTLYLQTNLLSGSVPKELGSLAKLQALNLGMNNLSGQLPAEIGNLSKLASFYINDNSLSGTLPAALLKLTELTYLRIDNNNLLFEDLLPVFSRLYAKSTLNFIYMPQKKLGTNKELTIPIGERVVLTVEGYESVTGDKFQWYKNGEYIPKADDEYFLIRSYAEQDSGYYTCRIYNSEVVDLYLECREIAINRELVSSADKAALLALYNATNGPGWTTKWNTSAPVYDWFGVTVTNGRVTSLRLPNNNLSGTIPSEIGQLSELTILDLTTNSLPGPIPPQISNLRKLNQLLLRSCKLTGSIPPEIGLMSGLNVLSLVNNQLTGPIPPELGKLKNLVSLELYTNSLTGPIPPEIGSMTSLTNLILYGNRLFGSIPQELANLSNLSNLYLYNNMFTGTLPASLAKLPKLSYLMVYGNRLSGKLPIELAYLSALKYFYFDDNLFQFSSLASVTDYYSFLMRYQPQKKIGREQQISLQNGESFLLEVPEYSAYTNDQLQWWRNGVLIPGATSNTYNVSVFNPDAMKGDYYLEIKNSKYPDLTIQSNNISVRPSASTDILSVLFAAQIKTPLVVYDSAKIYVDVAYGTNVTALTPSIRIPTGASVSPASGTVQNFSSPVSYTVTNGADSRTWQVRVRANPNDKANITAVTLAGSAGNPVINSTTNYIEMYIPYGGDPEKLAPQFTVSAGARIFPESGTVRDFTIPVYYTVTAQNSSDQKVWKVAVIVLPNTKSDINNVIIPGQTKSAVIDDEKKIVYCEVPYGTDFASLKPKIETSAGAKIEAVNLAKSFGLASEYLITSQDNSSSTLWKIVVNMAANTKADILGFMLSGQQGVIIDKENRIINVSVKKFQDLTIAIPLVLVSDFASVNPGSGVPVNLKDTVIYTVTAQDGINTTIWRVVTNIVTGLDEVRGTGIQVYPNPASEVIYLELQEGETRITLLDINGKPERMELVRQPGTYAFDLTGLANGAYLLKTESNKVIRTTVIIKQ